MGREWTKHVWLTSIIRFFSQASGLFVVGIAISRRNGLSEVGILVAAYPVFFMLFICTRYVLKNKDTDEVLFVVVFSLLHKEDVEKEEAESKRNSENTKMTNPETLGVRHEGEKEFEPEVDDLD